MTKGPTAVPLEAEIIRFRLRGRLRRDRGLLKPGPMKQRRLIRVARSGKLMSSP
jgi:hypothetical protein